MARAAQWNGPIWPFAVCPVSGASIGKADIGTRIGSLSASPPISAVRGSSGASRKLPPVRARSDGPDWPKAVGGNGQYGRWPTSDRMSDFRAGLIGVLKFRAERPWMQKGLPRVRYFRLGTSMPSGASPIEFGDRPWR